MSEIWLKKNMMKLKNIFCLRVPHLCDNDWLSKKRLHDMSIFWGRGRSRISHSTGCQQLHGTIDLIDLLFFLKINYGIKDSDLPLRFAIVRRGHHGTIVPFSSFEYFQSKHHQLLEQFVCGVLQVHKVHKATI